MSEDKKNLIIILGPTAVGKTKLAIQIAKHLSTEIISADARQFYKELKIGTAPPSKEDLETIKHHCIANLSIHDYYNVSRFEQDGLQIINQIFQKNDYAIMVGGSGLYIDAICNGIDVFPDIDENLRTKLKNDLKEKGIEYIRQMLFDRDPDYFLQVDLNNHSRMLRALEVCIQTNKPFTAQRLNLPKKRNFQIIKIGLTMDRNDLYEKINQRVDAMIQSGLIEEAKQLYQFKTLNALKTVGYSELFDYFDNKISLETAIEKIKTNSRRYAKRQLTWFRKDKSINWFYPYELNNIINFIHYNTLQF